MQNRASGLIWLLIFGCAAALLLGGLAQFDNSSAHPASARVATVTPEPSSVPQVLVEPANLSPDLAEIVKLAQAHVGEDVMLAYIQNSGQKHNPTADDLLYLTNLGVSQKVLAALFPPQPVTEPVAAAAPPPQPVEPADTPQADPAPNNFVDTLSSYGNWIDVADYGSCWQPTVAALNSDWRPYCDQGRWIYTDAGWYWQSDYAWGEIAFHYGRWWNNPATGWVWVPDSVWAPAWVTWRITDRYLGWAPLPPGTKFELKQGLVMNHNRVKTGFDFGLTAISFTFVKYSHLLDPNLTSYNASPQHAAEIFSTSTIVNNYIVRGKTIVNAGVSREHVATLSHQSIQTVALQDIAPVGSATATARGTHRKALRPEASMDPTVQLAKQPAEADSTIPVMHDSTRSATHNNWLASSTGRDDGSETPRATMPGEHSLHRVERSTEESGYPPRNVSSTPTYGSHAESQPSVVNNNYQTAPASSSSAASYNQTGSKSTR